MGIQNQIMQKMPVYFSPIMTPEAIAGNPELAKAQIYNGQPAAPATAAGTQQAPAAPAAGGAVTSSGAPVTDPTGGAAGGGGLLASIQKLFGGGGGGGGQGLQALMSLFGG